MTEIIHPSSGKLLQPSGFRIFESLPIPQRLSAECGIVSRATRWDHLVQRFENRAGMPAPPFSDDTNLTSQGAKILLDGEDQAFLLLGSEDLQCIFSCMVDRVALEAQESLRNEMGAFVSRFGRIVDGIKKFEKLRDAVDEAAVIDLPLCTMREPTRAAAEALDRAVATARREAQSMRRSIWSTLAVSERLDRLDGLHRRLELASQTLAAGRSYDGTDDLRRIADLLAFRGHQHRASMVQGADNPYL